MFPQWSGSSFNPSSAWIMGERPEGFTEIKFPFPLDNGWYKSLPCTKFRVFEHRKEEMWPFKHEFIVIRLVDGPLCYIERMGDPNARFDALGGQGSVAQDIAQYFKTPELSHIHRKPSKLISRIKLPCEFDIMDVLKVCRAIHEGEKTRNYTLQVYNCYFFTLAIQACLTRLVAQWEGEQLFEAWSSDFNKSVENLTDTATDDTTSNFRSHHPLSIHSRICSLFNPHSHQPTSIKSRLKAHMATNSTNLQRDMAYHVNDILWRSTVDSGLSEFVKEKVQEFLGVIALERAFPDQGKGTSLVEDLAGQTSSSGLAASVQSLKVEILTNVTNLLKPTVILSQEIQAESNTQGLKSLKHKPVNPSVKGHCPIENTREMSYNPAKQATATGNTTTTWYQPSFRLILLLIFYCWTYFPYFLLWVLYEVQNVWSIVLFAPESNKLPCIILEQKLDPLVAELEELGELTELHLESFAEKLRPLVGNQFAVWNTTPWEDICEGISKGISTNLLDLLEESKSKPKLCIQYQEYSEFITQDVSVFQKHILERIEIHAKIVGVIWPFSNRVKAELEQTLSRVWKNIRNDTIVAEKTVDLSNLLAALTDLLRQAPLFSLTDAIDDLSWFFGVHEGVVSSQNEYNVLRTQFEALFKDLLAHLSSTPSVMTTGMLSLGDAIQTEIRAVYGTEDRHTILRCLEAGKDLDDVLGCYRRVQGHLKKELLVRFVKLVEGRKSTYVAPSAPGSSILAEIETFNVNSISSFVIGFFSSQSSNLTKIPQRQNKSSYAPKHYSSAAPADTTNTDSRSTKEAEYHAGKPTIQAQSQNKLGTLVGYDYVKSSQHKSPPGVKILSKTSSDMLLLPIPTSTLPEHSCPPQHSPPRRSKGLPKEASPEPQRRTSARSTSHRTPFRPRYHKEDVVDFSDIYSGGKARPAGSTLPMSKPIDEFTCDSIYSLAGSHTVDMAPPKPGRLALAASCESRSSKKDLESRKRQTRNRVPSRTEELDNDPELDDLEKSILGDIAAIGGSSPRNTPIRGAFHHALNVERPKPKL